MISGTERGAMGGFGSDAKRIKPAEPKSGRSFPDDGEAVKRATKAIAKGWTPS